MSTTSKIKPVLLDPSKLRVPCCGCGHSVSGTPAKMVTDQLNDRMGMLCRPCAERTDRGDQRFIKEVSYRLRTRPARFDLSYEEAIACATRMAAEVLGNDPDNPVEFVKDPYDEGGEVFKWFNQRPERAYRLEVFRPNLDVTVHRVCETQLVT